MPPHNLQQMCFGEGWRKKTYKYSYVTIHLTPGNHYSIKSESTLPDDVFTQDGCFLLYQFLRRILKIFLKKVLFKISTPTTQLWLQPYRGDHDFNKLVSTLNADAST